MQTLDRFQIWFSSYWPNQFLEVRYSYFYLLKHLAQKFAHGSDRVEGMLPQNMPLWHTDGFKLKLLEKPVHEGH